DSRQAFSEDSSPASHRPAVELTGLEKDFDRDTAPGQIGQRSGIAAVDTCRRLMTDRAMRWELGARESGSNPVMVGRETFKFEINRRQNSDSVESELHLEVWDM